MVVQDLLMRLAWPAAGVWLVAVPGVCLLWAVGAQRRLRRLRRQAMRRFAALAPVLREQHRWACALARETVADPARLEPEAVAWHQRLHASGRQAQLLLQCVQRQPLAAPAMAGLQQARHVLHAVLRAGAPVSQHVAAPASDGLPSAGPPAEWARLMHQELPLLRAFNEGVAAYNAAVSECPALLVAAALRYRPAASLPALERHAVGRKS